MDIVSMNDYMFVREFNFRPRYIGICLLVLLDFMSLLNVWGPIATVLTCSSDTLTKVLLHRNAMQQTQDMTPHPVTSCHCAIHWCGTSHGNSQLLILMSFLPQHSTHTANAQLFYAGMMVVGQKLGRKCTVPTGCWTRDLWCANPLRYLLAHSCFLVLWE